MNQRSNTNRPRHLPRACVALAALASVAAPGCGDATLEGAASEEPLGAHRLAITEETSRIERLLREGSDGTAGFILQEVGGPVLERSRARFAYNPASSVKTLVAVALLREIDAGADFDLNTRVPHVPLLDGSCPRGSGFQFDLPLGTLLDDMLTVSSNTATRTLIDFLGGFPAINAVARQLGMRSTTLVVYPGCNITNRMTQADAARLYEGVADGSLLSARSRVDLYARMPAESQDFSGTLAAVHEIIDEEGAAAGIVRSQIEGQIKPLTRLHYKAGNDIFCTPNCRSFYSISGSLEMPSCENERQALASYVWGLFISGGTNENATSATFFANQAEPLRIAIRQDLAAWATCGAP